MNRQMGDERFQSLIVNIPDVVWTTDSGGRTTYISPNVERVYGYTPHEIYQAGSKLWLARIHPEDIDSVRAAYEALFTENELFDVEYRIQHKDGHWIWLHDRAVASYERDSTTYADGMFSDVTARVQREQQMAILNEQFRLISEVGHRITSILDIDVLLKEIAHLVREAMGYYLVGIALVEGEELVFKEGAGGVWEIPGFEPPRIKISHEGITGWVARHGEPLLVPDVSADRRYYGVPQASEIQSEVAVPLKAQQTIVGVLHAQSDRLNAFDASDVDMLQSLAHQAAIAIENARSYASAQQELAARRKTEAALQKVNEELEQRVEERTAELAASNASLRAEIAERARAEGALRDSEVRYRTLFESANDAIFVLHNGRFVEGNRAIETMFGGSYDDLLGRSPAQLSPLRQPDGSSSEDLALAKIDAALEGTPQFFEWVHRRMDGTPFNAEVSLNRFSLGGEDLVLALVRDVTERKRAEEALRRYTERLRILHEIDQGILAVRSPEAIAQAAVNRMRQLVPCRRVGIAVIDAEHNEAIILAADAETETTANQGTRFPLHGFEDLMEVVQRDQIVTWESLQGRGRPSDILVAEGVRANTSVPLVAQGELIGFLTLGTAAPGLLTPEHIDIARQVADQLAIVIHQARLYEQVQRHASELEQRVSARTRELSVLYEMAALASQPLDLVETLRQSLDQILAAAGSDTGIIHLLDEAGVEPDTLSMVVQRGLSSDWATALASMPSGAGLGGWIVEHDEPLIVPDLASDPRIRISFSAVDPLAYVGMPLRAGGKTLGVLSIIRRADRPQLNLEEISLLTSVADQLGSIVESAQLRRQAERAAVLEERERLSRDLHDSVTQLLYSINLFARSGRNALDMGEQDKLERSLTSLGTSAQQALREMRLLVYELRPPVLDREGLAGALRHRLDAVETRVGIEAHLSVDGVTALSQQTESELYRIAVEALNNALKYAQATSVTVRLDTDSEETRLVVTDNGHGFDPGATEGRGGLGLVGMRERAANLGGTLTIISEPGEGTEIKAIVPTT